MSDGGVLGQQLGHMGGVRHLVVVLGIMDKGDAAVGTDVGHALAIGAVGADEHLVLVTHHAGKHALHSESAAALHQHGGVVILGDVGQLQQLTADLLGDHLVVIIPGAAVYHHLPLYGIGSGQRTGGQQFISIHGMKTPFNQPLAASDSCWWAWNSSKVRGSSKTEGLADWLAGSAVSPS